MAVSDRVPVLIPVPTDATVGRLAAFPGLWMTTSAAMGERARKSSLPSKMHAFFEYGIVFYGRVILPGTDRWRKEETKVIDDSVNR